MDFCNDLDHTYECNLDHDDYFESGLHGSDVTTTLSGDCNLDESEEDKDTSVEFPICMISQY